MKRSVVNSGFLGGPGLGAVPLWMANREIIEKVHAEQSFMSVRSFEYVKTKANPLPDFVLPSAETLAALEADLDEWFSKKRRGKYSKVFVYPKEGCTWFLVRHGRPYARERSWRCWSTSRRWAAEKSACSRSSTVSRS
jgi:hypothetical protein